MIGVISDVCSESPIVHAVFEQISQWHCCVRKPMNEDGFKKSFRIVDGPTSRGNTENG